MQLSKGSGIVENDARSLAYIGENSFDIIDQRTPFHIIAESEERGANLLSDEIQEVRIGAVAALLGYLFARVNGKLPSIHEIALRLFLTAYLVAPALIDGMSLDFIGKLFGRTRACLSKRAIGMNEALNVKSRNQKGSLSVEVYRETTTEFHKQKRIKERTAFRKTYLKAWRAANAAEVKSYQSIYRKTNKARLNAARRTKRKGKQK